jgi:hypothetical protein
VPLLVLRRHPEQSEGSLYFALGLGLKIKLNFLSYFPLAKKCLFYHHVYHTLDHILTTKTPRSTARFFPNPLYLLPFRSSPPRPEKPLHI